MASDGTTKDSKGAVLENPLSGSPTVVEWMQEIELGYNAPAPLPKVCFGCGKETSAAPNTKLSKCAKCSVAAYCSKECQVSDWKSGKHRLACPSYARAATTPISEDVRKAIRNDLYSRIRFYACPYAVFRTRDLGRGFLFLQSDKTLQDMSVYIPKDFSGRNTGTRSILIHFLTLGEFDTELSKEDFELSLVRTKLKEAIEQYDEEKEMVLLCKFRCGHMALGKAVLVPDFKICQKLGHDYYANNPSGALQLNLDDM
ncbi:MAG: hypothetical protein SGILL_002561 [Bacillariaceae sp.]